MMHMIRVPFLCIALCAYLSLPSSAFGQSTSVSVLVSEETGGLFESRIRSALRALGDVEITSYRNSPDYRLTVMVMCMPDQDNCRTATRYGVSLQVSAPMSSGFLLLALSSSDSPIPDDLAWETLESAADYLQPFEYPLWAGVATFGRGVYQQSIDEWVAMIDAQCFEVRRRRARAFDRISDGDPEGGRAMLSEIEQENSWNC